MYRTTTLTGVITTYSQNKDTYSENKYRQNFSLGFLLNCEALYFIIGVFRVHVFLNVHKINRKDPKKFHEKKVMITR